MKCPYKYREGLRGSTEDVQFCLDQSKRLKHTQPYYHQVQLHMHVCDVGHCDLVVWTKTKFVVQRIARNIQFLHNSLPRAQHVFVTCVLPELLTRRHDPLLERDKTCKLCGKPDYGKTVDCAKCDSHFHYSCAQIKWRSAKWLYQECGGKECHSAVLPLGALQSMDCS